MEWRTTARGMSVKFLPLQTTGGLAHNAPSRSGRQAAREMLDDEELQRVYQWVDEIPLSRPKRSIARDFADGVLVAEIVCHYFPKMIELHNYSNANGYAQKIYNWCVRHREGVCEQRAPVISGSTYRLSPLPQEHAQPEGLQEARLPAAEGGDGRAVQLPDAGGGETTEDAADEDGQVRPRTQGPWRRWRRNQQVPTPPPPPCLPGTARSVLRPVMRRATRGRSSRRRRRAPSPRPRGDQRRAGRRPHGQGQQTGRYASCSPRRT